MQSIFETESKQALLPQEICQKIYTCEQGWGGFLS